MVYGDALFSGVHNLMTMENAPVDSRARTLIAKLRGVAPLLAAARANVTAPPLVYAQKGLDMFRGASATLDGDVRLAFAAVSGAPLRDSLARAAAAARRHAAWRSGCARGSPPARSPSSSGCARR